MRFRAKQVLAGVLGGAMALAAPLSAPPERMPSGEERGEALSCLALNIYWEARSEPETGRQAIAAVTLNRVAHPDFPKTVCDVVKQGGEKLHQCQFSWWCDGRNDTPGDAEAWHRARTTAGQALDGKLPDPTSGALYFHASYVAPDWAPGLRRTHAIGRHVFYAARKPGRPAEGIQSPPPVLAALPDFP